MASEVASVRLETPSLEMMLLTWVFTVETPMTSCSAISELVRPSASSARIWRSRVVSASPTAGGVATALMRASAASGASVARPWWAP